MNVAAEPYWTLTIQNFSASMLNGSPHSSVFTDRTRFWMRTLVKRNMNPGTSRINEATSPASQDSEGISAWLTACLEPQIFVQNYFCLVMTGMPVIFTCRVPRNSSLHHDILRADTISKSGVKRDGKSESHVFGCWYNHLTVSQGLAKAILRGNKGHKFGQNQVVRFLLVG